MLVATFSVLDRFMPLVRAVNCVSRAHGFVVCFVDLAVHFAGDRVMPILVAFVPAMRRVDCIDSAGRTVSHFVGFLIDITRDLGDLELCGGCQKHGEYFV